MYFVNYSVPLPLWIERKKRLAVSALVVQAVRSFGKRFLFAPAETAVAGNILVYPIENANGYVVVIFG